MTSSEFFDLVVDPFEKHSLNKDSLSGAAKMVAAELQKVLDQFSNAGPAELDLAFVPTAERNANEKKNK